MLFNDLLTDQRNEKVEKYSQLKKFVKKRKILTGLWVEKLVLHGQTKW